MNDPKEIKAEIRRLRKLKLACRPGTAERLDLEHKIKDLKKQLIEVNIPEPEKDNIIAEILKVDTLLGKLDINLKKFSITELQKHLDIINKKRPVGQDSGSAGQG
jgi:uncharacterized protein with von Willebrand factor type A (vWA) domain